MKDDKFDRKICTCTKNRNRQYYKSKDGYLFYICQNCGGSSKTNKGA